jgi:monothiol glutaredoxin
MDDQVKTLIDEMVNTQKVFLFMKGTPTNPQCGFTERVVDILNRLEVKFGSFNILIDDKIRQGVKEYSNWPTLPQLYINGKFIGGCDIVIALYEKGQLQKLLSEIIAEK